MMALHCTEYARIRVLSNPFFPCKLKIVNSLLIREIQVRENPYSDIFYVVLDTRYFYV